MVYISYMASWDPTRNLIQHHHQALSSRPTALQQWMCKAATQCSTWHMCNLPALTSSLIHVVCSQSDAGEGSWRTSTHTQAHNEIAYCFKNYVTAWSPGRRKMSFWQNWYGHTWQERTGSLLHTRRAPYNLWTGLEVITTTRSLQILTIGLPQ